jgi:ribosomal protein S18 acetylase RimI-like enzyme
MHIRPFHETDEPAVAALWTAVFNYPAAHNQPAVSIRRKLAVQRELFFVALINEEIVGTVMGGYDGHRGWIYALAVHPDYRQQGIGTALMHHIEHALRERDCPKINLQLVAANAATVAFYEKLGYHVEERISMGKIL